MRDTFARKSPSLREIFVGKRPSLREICVKYAKYMLIFIFIYEWQSVGGYVKIILNYYLYTAFHSQAKSMLIV